MKQYQQNRKRFIDAYNLYMDYKKDGKMLLIGRLTRWYIKNHMIMERKNDKR